MQILVDEDLYNKFPFNFKKVINELITIIPAYHTLHLEKIEVLYCSSKREKIAGYYNGGENCFCPKVVLYPEVIFNKMPTFLFYIFPIIPKLLFASALFHEIGHHYQRIVPGIKKEKWEQNAEIYVRRMNKLTFGQFKWLFLILFWPFLLIKKIKRK